MNNLDFDFQRFILTLLLVGAGIGLLVGVFVTKGCEYADQHIELRVRLK